MTSLAGAVQQLTQTLLRRKQATVIGVTAIDVRVDFLFRGRQTRWGLWSLNQLTALGVKDLVLLTSRMISHFG